MIAITNKKDGLSLQNFIKLYLTKIQYGPFHFFFVSGFLVATVTTCFHVRGMVSALGDYYERVHGEVTRTCWSCAAVTWAGSGCIPNAELWTWNVFSNVGMTCIPVHGYTPLQNCYLWLLKFVSSTSVQIMFVNKPYCWRELPELRRRSARPVGRNYLA